MIIEIYTGLQFLCPFYIYGRFSYFAVKYIFVLQDFIIRIIYSKYNYIFFTFLCIFSFTENENDCIIHHTNFVFTELMFCIKLQKGKTVSKIIFMSKSFYLIVFHLNQNESYFIKKKYIALFADFRVPCRSMY